MWKTVDRSGPEENAQILAMDALLKLNGCHKNSTLSCWAPNVRRDLHKFQLLHHPHWADKRRDLVKSVVLNHCTSLFKAKMEKWAPWSFLKQPKHILENSFPGNHGKSGKWVCTFQPGKSWRISLKFLKTKKNQERLREFLFFCVCVQEWRSLLGYLYKVISNGGF